MAARVDPVERLKEEHKAWKRFHPKVKNIYSFKLQPLFYNTAVKDLINIFAILGRECLNF